MKMLNCHFWDEGQKVASELELQCSSSNNGKEIMTVTNVTLVTNFDLFEMHMHPNVNSECQSAKKGMWKPYTLVLCLPNLALYRVPVPLSYKWLICSLYVHTFEQNSRIVFSCVFTELFNQLLAWERCR